MATARFDILLAGVGLGDPSHTTLATVDALRAARVVYSLSVHQKWLESLCRRVVNLESEYYTGEEDVVVYAKLVRLILAQARKRPGVALVGDGHPLFLDDVCREIVRRSRRSGLRTLVLPAISSLDTMAAEHDVEISGNGLQMFEASTLVAHKQPINPSIPALVFQIGWFGSAFLVRVDRHLRQRFLPLQRYLSHYYPADHRVRILQTAYGRAARGTSITARVDALASRFASIPVDSTLYIPALETEPGEDDVEFLQRYYERANVTSIARLK